MYNTDTFQTSTHAVGGGEWTIEVRHNGDFVKEFCGSNGSINGEDADDLWSEFDEWRRLLPDDPNFKGEKGTGKRRGGGWVMRPK